MYIYYTTVTNISYYMLLPRSNVDLWLHVEIHKCRPGSTYFPRLAKNNMGIYSHDQWIWSQIDLKYDGKMAGTLLSLYIYILYIAEQTLVKSRHGAFE